MKSQMGLLQGLGIEEELPIAEEINNMLFDYY